VRKASGRASLAPEPVDERGIAREGAMEHLDRDLAGQDGVVRPEDLTHPAGGDAFHHVVTAVEGDEGLPSAVRRRRLRDTSRDGALLPGKRSRAGRSAFGAS
jgi:hypothetical protein